MADSLTNILDMLRQRGTIDPKTIQQLGGRNPAISADIYPPKPAAPKPPAVQPTMTGATRANAKVTHTGNTTARATCATMDTRSGSRIPDKLSIYTEADR
jgi:hypothetical protein